MCSEYRELDGSRVVAILEKDCVPALQWEGDPIDAGRIVGLVRDVGFLTPVWLTEVLERNAESLRVVVRCMLGAAAACDWYGPPTWESVYEPGAWHAMDTGPCNYDVYGVLPGANAGPPVVVDLAYVVVPRLRMFVPPPYRRKYCWYTEKAVADNQRRARLSSMRSEYRELDVAFSASSRINGRTKDEHSTSGG